MPAACTDTGTTAPACSYTLINVGQQLLAGTHSQPPSRAV